MARGSLLRKRAIKVQKNLNLRFTIDCSQPCEDKVLVMKHFQDFLEKRIKVQGKTGNMGDEVALASTDKAVVLTSQIPFSKRYLKYLTKKYLKKQQLRDYIHVLASDKNTYKLKYFNINQEEMEEE